MTTPTVLSLFSGVGGFDLGLERAGMRTVFQCEWDKHATRILERHWPDVPRWGDISTLTAHHILTHAPIVDVVAWGSPCQDLSVAGRRAGLDGSRSGLFHEGMRIIRELREATNGKYPRISVWENVYGALNSNRGADFGVILDEMAAAGALVQEWRVLDAQYFGVPQRRRRVFLVSVFDPATAERCPDPLLPVREGVRWNPSTREESWQHVASTTATGFGNGGGIANTIPAEFYHKSTVVNQDVNNGHLIVGTLAARDYKGVGNQYVQEGKLVVESVGFTGTSHAQYGQGVGTLRANGGNLGGGSETLLVEPVFFQMHQSGETRIQNDVMHTLASYMGTGGNNTPMVVEPIAVQGTVVGRKDHNGPGGKGFTEDGPMYTLTVTDTHLVAQQSVRRLTPLECERLMGWPDNWTEGQADSHRYKQCGNGVASPVAEWIGQQLQGIICD